MVLLCLNIWRALEKTPLHLGCVPLHLSWLICVVVCLHIHAYCFPVLSKFCYNTFNPRGLFMSTPTTKKQSTMKNSVSKASILRAVRSEEHTSELQSRPHLV